MNALWILLVQDIKFYTIIDRMIRDASKYIQYCLLCLIEATMEVTIEAIKQIRTDFTAAVSN